MPNILSSWKEISQYLGKGVRTVQRWEREAGLPVRRREHSARVGVLAIPEELDDWARSSTRGPVGPIADSLRKELMALREETTELRRRIEAMEADGCAPARKRIEMVQPQRSRAPERAARSRVAG